MDGMSVYFIHNTRGLPGGSPHSLVNMGFSEMRSPFLMPLLTGLPEIYQIWRKRETYRTKRVDKNRL